MIKILKEGVRRNFDVWYYFATCPFCMCEISYNRSDIQKQVYTKNYFFPTFDYYVICPYCIVTKIKVDFKKTVYDILNALKESNLFYFDDDELYIDKERNGVTFEMDYYDEINEIEIDLNYECNRLGLKVIELKCNNDSIFGLIGNK